MLRWRRICCPVDFSPPSRLAMHVAAELARMFEAELTLVHVYEDADACGDVERGLLVWKEEAQETAKVQIDTMSLRGDPVSEIIRWAGEHRCNAIVLGSHSRGPIEHLLLGSVAEGVVRRAPTSVLTVRMGVSPD